MLATKNPVGISTRYGWIFMLSLVLLAGGCSSAVVQTPGNPPKTDLPKPEATGTIVVQPVPLPSATPTLAASPTATPAATPRPSPTVTPTATPNLMSGRVVFVSRREDTNQDGVIDSTDSSQLYVLDLATKALTQLTSGSSTNNQPAWSPDGKRIVFISNRTGNNDIFVIKADGSGLKQLTQTPDNEYFPIWSPDGTKIAGSGYKVSDKL